jgi:hypothetical protein
MFIICSRFSGCLDNINIFVKLSKCEFAQQELEYLGHIISSVGVATDPRKTEAMREWPVPTNITKFCWSAEAQTTFEKLKSTVSSTPVLALLDFSKPFIVETGASDVGFGAVLMQEDKPVAFISKPLNVTHKSLPIYEKEFLALILAVDKWRQYL